MASLRKTSDDTVTMAESLDFKCIDCGQVLKTENGFNIRIERLHKGLNPSTPEKERSNSNSPVPYLSQ